MKLRSVISTAAMILSVQAVAADPEYVMSCEEIASRLEREVTAEARERYKDLRGSCLGVVDRDGALYLHTKMVVRRVSGSRVTIYVPANDTTIEVTPDSSARVILGGQKVRPRDLVRGQELNLYVSVDAITEPVIEEVLMPTEEEEELVPAPAAAAVALPTTG
jgi:hypothetical protein